MDDLVKRLRDWETIYPCDIDKPDGSLYVEAADRLNAAEARIAELEDAGQKLLANWQTEEQARTAAEARIAELECHLSAICEQADRPEYSGRYAELLRRIAEASAALGEKKE